MVRKQISALKYVGIIAGTCLSVLAAACVYIKQHDDFVATISLNGDPTWYRDFAGRNIPEIQDQDLFYHNIGNAVSALKASDIAFVGPSFVSYALDGELMQLFGDNHDLKLYNFSFIGIRSGAFTRSIVKRWQIQPKLWVINVDNQFSHFFSDNFDLSLGPNVMSIPTIHYAKFKGMVNVAGRNLRWRFEDWLAYRNGAPHEPTGIYRNTQTGSFHFTNPGYYSKENKRISVMPNRECRLRDGTVSLAKDFLKDLGGKVVLMLVPHNVYCPDEARELAKALNVEVILSPNENLTSVDGGGHLDKDGAIEFTQHLLSELEKTQAYKSIVAEKNKGL